MRVAVLAFAAICVAQPAFARAPAHKHSHHSARHHHVSQHHAARHHVRHHARRHAVRARYASAESGHGTSETFARTDAWQTPQAWPQQNAWQPAPAQNFATFSDPSQPRLRRAAPARSTALDGAIARHAAANGLPVDLVHRVVRRESNYNPRASSKGNIGLMQIRYQTARGIGYTGSASGLLDAETNLTYAVRYLAGAYQAAGGNQSRAVSLYASGYHGRGVRVARAPRTMESQQPAWGGQSQRSQNQSWGRNGQLSDLQNTQVAMRGDAMTEAVPRRRYRR